MIVISHPKSLAMLVAVVALTGMGCSTTPPSGNNDSATIMDGSAPDSISRDALASDVAAQPDIASPVNCPTDSYGNNHSQSTATELSQKSKIDGLVVCAGQDDWFTVQIPDGYGMQFDACIAKGADAVELSFFQDEFPEPEHYRGGGINRDKQTCVSTTLSYTPRRYYFRVHTKAAQAAYSINLFLSPNQPIQCANEGESCSTTETCHSGACQCNTDPFEPNDSAAAAKQFPLGVTSNLIACTNDEDWYSIDASGKNSLQIHVETAQAIGNGYFLSLAVFDPEKLDKPIQFIGKTTWTADYKVALPKSGTYLLRTRAANLTRTYKLSVTAQ